MTDAATTQAADKRHADLLALAALKGLQLYRLANGCWLACRWGLTKELDDAEVEAWLRRLGGAA